MTPYLITLTIILRLALISLLIGSFAYVCYLVGVGAGIRQGRIDEQVYQQRRAVLGSRQRKSFWIGYN